LIVFLDVNEGLAFWRLVIVITMKVVVYVLGVIVIATALKLEKFMLGAFLIATTLFFKICHV
jgi:hypothetical protein